MVGKLLKYDLKRQGKVVLVYDLIVILGAVVFRIFNNGTKVQSLLVGLFALLLMGCVLVPILHAWYDAIKHIYKDEGYLTNTLPIKTRTIYLSHWSSSMILLLMSIVCMCLCIMIGIGTSNSIHSMIDMAAQMMGMTSLHLIVLTVIVFYFEVAFGLSAGYTGIVIGYSAYKDKAAKAVLSGIVCYMVGSILSIAALYGYGKLFDPSLLSMFSDEAGNPAIVAPIFYMGTVYYIIVCVCLNLISLKKLSNGIELE
ncbi:hypothetical protein C815_01499 [Firmicutes bacterium M10-2]|nr:hypothetical protein C815_01499 [Firmicutes bacterium M10-2]